MASLYRRNDSKIWWVRFQLHGLRVQKSSGKTRKSDALRFLAKAMEEERQRQEQGYRKVRLGLLCEEYDRQHLPVLQPRTRANYRCHLIAIKAHFGEDHYIDEVRKTHIAEFIAYLKRSGLKTPTIRRYLASLSSLFSFAARSGWLVQNPLSQFDKRGLPEAMPRTRFLSLAEYRRLLTCSQAYLRPLIEMAVETGMRAEELFGLRWDQVELDRREIRLVVTKSKRPRVVPLSDRAVAILVASSRIAGSPHVFTNPQTGRRYRNLSHSFRRACSLAGIKDFRWHDLRHTFASWHVQSGTDLYRVSRILGHSTLQMSARYAHLATEHLHQAVRDMATSMATLASDSPEGPRTGRQPSST
jgi:integrase/recombinase XerD